MSVKLSRYVFRRIGGRIIPIRKGTEAVANLTKNNAKKYLKKLKGLRG